MREILNISNHLGTPSSASSSGLLLSSQSIKNKVYDMLLKIPVGKVTTYGDIAKAIGQPNSSRLIGQILHNNPTPVVVPCHRVVCSNGKIGGYAFGSRKKRKLLEQEGLKFCGSNSTDLKEFQKHRITWPCHDSPLRGY
jgi:methylated-DNA-[protein]-cysteine S-methyltransferase